MASVGPEREPLAAALDESALRVVVVGEGLAALVAARELARPGFTVTLARGRPRAATPGHPHEHALDGGMPRLPLEFEEREGALRRILDELGLAHSVERPATEERWLALAPGARAGARRSMREPAALLLGMPASPLAADVAGVIGWRGAWRAFLDRVRPVLTIGQERRLDRLVRRRMGHRVLELLVRPAALARFGVPPERLDIAHAVPGLNPALTRTGTLSGAVTELLARPPAARAGLVGALPELLGALAVDAVRRGATLLESVAVRVSARPRGDSLPAEAAEPAGTAEPPEPAGTAEPPEPAEAADAREAAWCIELADGTALVADVVLLAVDPAEALSLTAGLRDVAAAERPGSPPTFEPPTVLAHEELTLLVRSPALDSCPRGARALVVGAEPGVAELVHETARWSSLREKLGEGRHVLRVRYHAHAVDEHSGSESAAEPSAVKSAAECADPHDGSRTETVERALREASAILEIDLADLELEEAQLRRVVEPAPFALEGQARRSAELRNALGALGVEVTGGWLAGLDPAAVAEHAADAAKRIRLAHWREVPDGGGQK